MLAPTRSNLLHSLRRLHQVRKGIELLTRKRRALVSDLLRLASPAIAARSQVQQRSAEATRALHAAAAVHGPEALAALCWPVRPIEVEVTLVESWGVQSGLVKRLTPVRRTMAGRGQAPGMTGPAAARAATEFEVLLELLLDAASTELLLRRLAQALARTSRQVNTLERRVAPTLAAGIERIREILEEREREDHTRLKHLLSRKNRVTIASRRVTTPRSTIVA
jgi:V/A-type H+/Na+-transporting ATPase subunit D